MPVDVGDLLMHHCMRALRPRPGQRCLDLGAGSGRVARELARGGAWVVAFDASSDALAKGPSPWTKNAVRCAGDALAMPFATRSFAAITSRHAFHHIHDLDGAFAEVGRVLAPGGRLAVIDGVAFGGDKVIGFLHRAFDLRDGGTHVRFATLPRWRALMLAARLHLVRVEARAVTHDFEQWARCANQPEPPLDQLRAHFQSASPAVRAALRIVPAVGAPVRFTTIEAVLLGCR
ncbi:MAG: methyltransferase domain-containing protein [Candidatus Wallbacteria bacterium]|nr:methyltransferase domain-containing protein [Candidatus Wallbacteria bacterium]